MGNRNQQRSDNIGGRKRAPRPSSLQCSAEWHLWQEHTPLAVFLYLKALRISKCDKDMSGWRMLFASVRTWADYFGVSHHTVSRALACLERTGFLVMTTKGGYTGQRRENGRLLSSCYRVLTHKEWCLEHPDRCRENLVKKSTTSGCDGATGPVARISATGDAGTSGCDGATQFSTEFEFPTSQFLIEARPAFAKSREHAGERDEKRRLWPDGQQPRQLRERHGPGFVPIDEMRAAVLAEIGKCVYFPKTHLGLYRQLLNDFSRDELVAAVRKSCRVLGNTFNYRGFSSWLLGAGDPWESYAAAILRANRRLKQREASGCAQSVQTTPKPAQSPKSDNPILSGLKGNRSDDEMRKRHANYRALCEWTDQHGGSCAGCRLPYPEYWATDDSSPQAQAV